ncbi:hypothetical protein [Cohnella nanjingensis]|uniref:Uncharacterized protein n=1 Tax=Cohnella nanjingensis TaxID=1387779 RepID=A0A7X0RN96_9BACL|nr:hypothetical protein [Cohnella nanjingensis]MBB6669199.1 hypothetical protein [Cohnella nanjingensis]
MLEHQYMIEKLAEYREAEFRGRNPWTEAELRAEKSGKRLPPPPKRGGWLVGIVMLGIGFRRGR